MEAILFAITFVFGTLRLLTWSKLFHTQFDNTIHVLLGVTDKTKLLVWLENALYIGSLLYQVYFFYNLILGTNG